MKHTMPVSYTTVSVVNAYLIARALAELLREQVDEIKREALNVCPLYDENGERITDIRQDWCGADDDEAQEYYNEISKLARERGIKPDNMPDEFCPALVAEDNVRKIEHIIVGAAAEELRDRVPGIDAVTVNGLLCLGLDEYKRFIDLIVGFTVNAPNFKRQ